MGPSSSVTTAAWWLMGGFLSLLQVFSQASVPPPLAAQPLAVEFRADQSVRDGAESAASQSEPGPADPGQL